MVSAQVDEPRGVSRGVSRGVTGDTQTKTKTETNQEPKAAPTTSTPVDDNAQASLIPDVPQPPATLDQRAERTLRPWWTALQETSPARVPAQSYATVKGVVRAALGNGKPARLVIAGLNVLVRDARAISGGTLQSAMTEAASLPNAPVEFRPYAAPPGNTGTQGRRDATAEIADLQARKAARQRARESANHPQVTGSTQ